MIALMGHVIVAAVQPTSDNQPIIQNKNAASLLLYRLTKHIAELADWPEESAYWLQYDEQHTL